MRRLSLKSTDFGVDPFVSEILGLFSKTIMEAKNEDKKVNAFALT